MKVGNINSVNFRSGTDYEKSGKVPDTRLQVNELPAVTPDFLVRTPQKYSKLGVEDIGSGLKLHQYKLANGLIVSVIPMEDSPAVVKNHVNVGSMNETQNIKGISHFLEHMAFNGTNGEDGHIKLETGDSFKKVDEMGGWANASTNYAITDYVNSTPLLKKSDLEQQIRIIAAMNEDLKLSDDMIQKEKYPVCSEINMILDDPQTIALDQTVRSLFGIKNPADEMVGGSVAHIKNLKRKDVLDYYNRYYTPDNMNLVITGNVDPDEAAMIAAKSFTSKKISDGKRFEENLTPLSRTVRKDFISDKARAAEIILGFCGPKNNETKEKVIYDVAQSYLLSYSAGLSRNLKQYNTAPYLSSEKISTNLNVPKMSYLALSVSNENCEKVLKEVFSTISSLKKPDEETLNIIKQKLLKDKEASFEYSYSVNDIIGSAVLNKDLSYITDYEKILNSITSEDVYQGLKKYFDLNKTAITIIHPENKEISFKGKSLKPVNSSRITEYNLPNGFDAGLYRTKNNNIFYNILLYSDKPYNEKAGVVDVLDEIYSMGNLYMNEDELNCFKEKNNIGLYASVTGSKLRIYSDGGSENRNLIFENAKKLLYSPAITEETLKKAKERIKDSFERRQNTAYDLYLDYDSKTNPYTFSSDEILENLDSITVEDVKKCHKYLLENSRGIITANIPDSMPEVRDEILGISSELDKVLPNKPEPVLVYKDNLKTEVITDANNNSQAEIMRVNRFKSNNTVRETVIGEITNSILSSSSIGLFDILREKEHLAYSVFSQIERFGDMGEISCNILTTTDNKNIGEYSYENVQKSIEGFNKQISALKAGEFTDKDLENAKLALKAELLNCEGTRAKLYSIDTGMNSKYGIEYVNKLYDEIDTITKQDILDFAEKAFKNPPVYTITASEDTLNYNKDYLSGLCS